MKKLARIISNVAPTLGTLVGGPLGTAGGAVVGKIAEALGAPADDEEAMVQALATASPEQIARVKEIEADFKVRMKELGIRPHELEVEDRKSAREMAKSEGNAPQVAFTVMLTLLIGAVTWALFDVEMPQENRVVAGTFLGVLIREWAGSMHFWFGTSIGSQKKDSAMLGAGGGS
jgi:hypothetical protein